MKGSGAIWLAVLVTFGSLRLGHAAVQSQIEDSATLFPQGINAHGQIIGFCAGPYFELISYCLWDEGVVQDLGIAPPSQLAVKAFLNDHGQIAAQGICGFREPYQQPIPQVVLWDRGAVIELGERCGAYEVQLIGINARSQVLWNEVNPQTGGYTHSFLWEDGRVTDLGTLDGISCTATDMNDRGQIVGYVEYEDTHSQAFLWERGTMTRLGEFGYAAAINNREQVLIGGSRGLLLWDKGVVTELGISIQPPGTRVLNDRGQVAGAITTQDFHARAAYWEGGVITELGTLEGSIDNLATIINDHGEILGISYGPEGEVHGFIWRRGSMTDLGTLGGLETYAVDMNERGQAVGYGRTASGNYHPFLWENGVMTDLATEPSRTAPESR